MKVVCRGMGGSSMVVTNLLLKIYIVLQVLHLLARIKNERRCSGCLQRGQIGKMADTLFRSKLHKASQLSVWFVKCLDCGFFFKWALLFLDLNWHAEGHTFQNIFTLIHSSFSCPFLIRLMYSTVFFSEDSTKHFTVSLNTLVLSSCFLSGTNFI